MLQNPFILWHIKQASGLIDVNHISLCDKFAATAHFDCIRVELAAIKN